MKKYAVICVVLMVFLYAAWDKVTSHYGVQKTSYKPAQQECFVENNFRYCIFRAQNGTNGNVAYRLHGRNLDETSWNDESYYTAMVQQYWTERNIKPPVIISVSYGKVWLLAPKGASDESGLLDDLKNQIPKIEEKLNLKPKERLLFGESMGGLNSLIFGFHASEMFSRIASLCPVIYNLSPFAPWTTFVDTITRTGADPKNIYGLLTVAKKYASNDLDWSKISPIDLIKSYNGKPFPLYLSCGLYDKYGNYEGVEILKNLALQKGFPIEWHPLYGGHCVIDVPSLAEFLAR